MASDTTEILALLDSALADTPAARESRDELAAEFFIHDLVEEMTSSDGLRDAVGAAIRTEAHLASVVEALDRYERIVARRTDAVGPQRTVEEVDAAREEIRKSMRLAATSVLGRAETDALGAMRLRFDRIETGLVKRRDEEADRAARAMAAQKVTRPGPAVGPTWNPGSVPPDRRVLAGLFAHHVLEDRSKPQFAARIARLALALGSDAARLETWLVQRASAASTANIPLTSDEYITRVLDWGARLRDRHTGRFDEKLIENAYAAVIGSGTKPAPINAREAQPVKKGRGADDDRGR